MLINTIHSREMAKSVWKLLSVFLVLPGIALVTQGCDRRSVESVYLDVDTVEIQDVCFDGIGCFNNSLYCHRFGFPPNHPDVIDTKFYLYTQWNRLEPDLLNTDDLNTFLQFSPRKETKIIIHGFMESHDMDHIANLKNAILEQGDYNVIMVNWSGGATGHYHTARLNIRVVGRQTANMMRFLVDTYSYSMAIHVIGHSLGAHAAGYAGEDFAYTVDRITGLDPAGPWFVDELDRCRLDASDASFVDVIHTNGNPYGFGLLDQLGHQDFYPNGGENMPGCGMFSVFCHHRRSILYFTDSLSCSFPAYRCDSWEDFTTDLCQQTCVNEGCAEMGFNADRNRAPGKYYLRTNKYQPFC